MNQELSRTKVLFITGWGRSGSTILSSVLGQLEGFVSVGELRFIWDRGLLRNLACACSEPFRDCPFWTSAVPHLLNKPLEEIQRVVHLRERFRTRDAYRRLVLGLGRTPDEGMLEYSNHLLRIYEGLRDQIGSRVIVDASKFPTHGYLASLSNGVDLFVLHLVRDPRAVAFSWKKKRIYAEADRDQAMYMPQYNPINSSVHWLARNLLAQRLWSGSGDRYLLVRYEDFAADPYKVVTRVRDFAGEECPIDFFVDERTIRMSPTHEVSGNPARFHAPQVSINPDSQWVDEMSTLDRLLSVACASPLLSRFGYGLGRPGQGRIS